MARIHFHNPITQTRETRFFRNRRTLLRALNTFAGIPAGLVFVYARNQNGKLYRVSIHRFRNA
jgi:hypothetical protein